MAAQVSSGSGMPSRTREQRLRDGIPLPNDTWAAIVGAAREVGVDERRIQLAGAA